MKWDVCAMLVKYLLICIYHVKLSWLDKYVKFDYFIATEQCKMYDHTDDTCAAK